MKVRNFSKREFNDFEELIPDSSSINTEALLFLVPIKDKWKRSYKLFKKFHINEGTTFSNKLATINTLCDYKKEINMNELIIPDELCSIDYNLEGVLMDYISGINLSKLLMNKKITLKEKINYLKQIGDLLSKMKFLRQNKEFKDFFLNDLHEDNIIIDSNGKIRIVDLDSSKIGGNLPSSSKYLVNLRKKGILNDKYKLDNYLNDIISPNEDTDNYCYIIIVLNMLYQENITKLSLDEFYNYIDYLNKIGIDKNLIDIFSNLYTNKPNPNCVNYLDYINNSAYQACKKVYEIKKGK